MKNLVAYATPDQKRCSLSGSSLVSRSSILTGSIRREAIMDTVRGEKIIILDRGNVEFAYPRDWTFTPDPEGFAKLVDPTDSVRLEASYLRLPPLPPDAPTVEERLRHALAEVPEAGPLTPIVTVERAAIQIAWADYSYECDDTERGERRAAHGRWLVAANRFFQALMTYYYWTDDAVWAVAAWERMVETLRLGNAVPLESPKDHWAVRGRTRPPRPEQT
jgi:hypothetical protein